MTAKKEIERHRLPCGPTTIAIDAVCRKRLKDHFDALLDRLTQETHPEGVDKDVLEMDEQVNDDELREKAQKAREDVERQLDNEGVQLENEMQKVLNDESPEEKKDRMIEEGKMRADVQHEVKKYKEGLMGNSRLLQSPSGKINKR
jgi:hypothetical protein